MRKTTVYLDEDAAAALRRLAAETGRPQAELVRDAVERYVAEAAPKRRFASAGAGASGREGSIADDEEALSRAGLDPDAGWS